jgi:hypothetical protein
MLKQSRYGIVQKNFIAIQFLLMKKGLKIFIVEHKDTTGLYFDALG